MVERNVKYETFEIEVDGYKIHATNDPIVSKRVSDKGNLFDCWLVVGNKYATAMVAKQMLEIEDGKKVILKMLLREIERL